MMRASTYGHDHDGDNNGCEHGWNDDDDNDIVKMTRVMYKAVRMIMINDLP